ncbi:MAG: glycosyl hydrolase family 28-related protein [Sulfitobacter sp.]
MNKVITEGIVLKPRPYTSGLDMWSSADGTPGADTYENAANALLIAMDQDFGGAIELLKTENTQKLRFMGETPMLPGCYLRVSVKVKAMSGNLPSVRIGGYPARGDGSKVLGLPEAGDFTALENHGEVVEISAIVGAGARTGVDMVWGTEPIYGHFGIDLIGPNDGIIRVDDFEIEDVTSVFLSDVVSKVDVVDYGAVGDGVTDSTAAFEAANAGANGRTVVVPRGVFRLDNDVTFDTPIEFEGSVSMPDTAALQLRRNFDLPTYIEAFKDEELAFKKAFQALLNNADHEALDMGGRKVSVTTPIDMQAAVPDRTTYATRRVIRNGQLEAAVSASWDTDEYTSSASYAAADPLTLTGVINVASIPVGSLVEGAGVGREVYVAARNLGQQEITLSKPLYDAEGQQDFTFRKFKYLIDFSGFAELSNFVLADIELQCNDRSSGLMMARSGHSFGVRDCFVTRPADRGITSAGTGCEGIALDRNHFLSAESALDAPARRTIGFNTNTNDAKVRNNRATQFRHFGVLGGANNLVTGNHLSQGDGVTNGLRTAGLVLSSTAVGSILSQNDVEDCFVEWTNEADASPAFTTGFSFCGLGITDNVFRSSGVAPWFSFVVIKPYGAGHFLNGLTITGNSFRNLEGEIDRVDRVDTTFAALDMGQSKNVQISGNAFLGVSAQVSNPAHISFVQGTEANAWLIDASPYLPFGGEAVALDALTNVGGTRDSTDVRHYDLPYADLAHGASRDHVQLVWPTAVRGRVQATVRMDVR